MSLHSDSSPGTGCPLAGSTPSNAANTARVHATMEAGPVKREKKRRREDNVYHVTHP